MDICRHQEQSSSCPGLWVRTPGKLVLINQRREPDVGTPVLLTPQADRASSIAAYHPGIPRAEVVGCVIMVGHS